MATSCLAWSALTIGTAFVKDFSQLVGVRVLLGAVEVRKSMGRGLSGTSYAYTFFL